MRWDNPPDRRHGLSGSGRYDGKMTDQPDPVTAEEARARRNKLIGRILIVGMGLLALVQIVPALMPH